MKLWLRRPDHWVACGTGSWRESTVAIKAIMHNATLSRKVDTLRESLVGISIQHPNVV